MAGDVNPWERNEGRFDKPSSSPVGEPIAPKSSKAAAKRPPVMGAGVAVRPVTFGDPRDPAEAYHGVDPVLRSAALAGLRELRDGIGEALARIDGRPLAMNAAERAEAAGDKRRRR